MGKGANSPYVTTTQREEQRRLGAQLRRVRELMGMTQEELAEGLDIESVTLSRYENGVHMCPLYLVRAVSRLSGISFHDFFIDDDGLTRGLLPGLLDHLQSLNIPAQVALADFFEAMLVGDLADNERLAKSPGGMPMFVQLTTIQASLKALGMDYEIVKDSEGGWLLWPSEFVSREGEDESEIEQSPPELLSGELD